ncbi:MAG TPA: hypothetical protein VFG68_21490, partial [Fimbriiglobus sp.]|nr:hypothetical protein [Fimbriiglobus sp.]
MPDRTMANTADTPDGPRPPAPRRRPTSTYPAAAAAVDEDELQDDEPLLVDEPRPLLGPAAPLSAALAAAIARRAPRPAPAAGAAPSAPPRPAPAPA